MKQLKWHRIAISTFVSGLQAIALEWVAPPEAASAYMETASVATPPSPTETKLAPEHKFHQAVRQQSLEPR